MFTLGFPKIISLTAHYFCRISRKPVANLYNGIAKCAGFWHRGKITISRLYFALQAQHYKNDGAHDHWRSPSPTPFAPPASPAVQPVFHSQPCQPRRESSTLSIDWQSKSFFVRINLQKINNTKLCIWSSRTILTQFGIIITVSHAWMLSTPKKYVLLACVNKAKQNMWWKKKESDMAVAVVPLWIHHRAADAKSKGLLWDHLTKFQYFLMVWDPATSIRQSSKHLPQKAVWSFGW